MSNGENAEKNGHAGRDYWSKRHPSMCLGWGGYGKWLTKKLERNQAKDVIRKEIEEHYKSERPE